MFRPLFLALFAATALTVAAQTPADSDSLQTPSHAPCMGSVGLVLSGGGAKGIAHIGVLQALEDNNIAIDYITGTSMGSIVGGLYACGYTPAEMMELIESRGFSYWSTGTIDPNLIYYELRESPTPTLATINFAGKKTSVNSSFLPSSLISPLPMNFAFMTLFAPYTAQCGENFDRLFVPFRCITSDVTHKRKVVCGSGSLGDAIRASMNFPVVFAPVERDGALLYDGGIYENYPWPTMREVFGPDVMIGIDVASTDEAPSPNEGIVDQLESMIIQRGSSPLPDNLGINLRIHLDRFGVLDFNAARTIYQIGYDFAMAHMDSIKARVGARISPQARQLRRQVFKSQTPALRIDTVTVSGGTKAQNRLLAGFFRPRHHADTIGVSEARYAFYRAISSGKLRNFVPQATYNDTTGLFDLHLNAAVKDNFGISVGGYISSSTSSMLFLSGAYRTLSLNSLNLSLNGWIGQSYLAGAFRGSISLSHSRPMSVKAELVASRHKYYQTERLFYEINEPTFVSTDEAFGRLLYSTALTRVSKAEAGIGAGYMIDRFYPDISGDFTTPHRQRTSRAMLQLLASISSSTLNNEEYPTAGHQYHLKLIGATGKYRFRGNPGDITMPAGSQSHSFGQAEARTRNYWTISRHFSLGIETDLLFSSRPLLPNYYATIVEAPAFNPTPSSYSVFDPDFRAHSFMAGGIVPIWRFSDMLQVRGTFYAYAPLRRIELADGGGARYGKWLSESEFFGELAGVVSLPFANVSAYCRYSSTPAGRWNVGLSLGLFFLAPRFLR